MRYKKARRFDNTLIFCYERFKKRLFLMKMPDNALYRNEKKRDFSEKYRQNVKLGSQNVQKRADRTVSPELIYFVELTKFILF